MQQDNLILWILAGVYLTFNLYSFSIILADKSQSRDGKRRISEGDLFFWAICFGALGVLLGMKAARHKTKKWKFLIGAPLAFAQNLALILGIFYLLR